MLLPGKRSRHGSASEMLLLACSLEKGCPGVGPSGVVDSCTEMLKMNPLNFSGMMRAYNVFSSVRAIAPWPALHLHFGKDRVPDFPELNVVERDECD